ncbi:N-6 DNA methylase [Candidatus Woesearchaeota archaeon]|nr:N-6 DNA methylase [Candidatus Woesearchaeota archaeon]
MGLTKEEVKHEILKLISLCNKKIEVGEIEFNEEQTCNDLIKPLFKVLGWDVDNQEYDEFICQSKLGRKRLDYLVKCDGISRFFVEAKKLNRDIYNNEEDYTQTLKYGRSNGLPFAILTNFREFLILYCNFDTSNIFQTIVRKRIKLLDGFNDEDFDLIWEFSKERIKNKDERFNLLKKHINPNVGFREPVDKELTIYFWKWRDKLLRNVKSHRIKNNITNDTDFGYIEEELQRFIDRFIFICYCEDNEIEDVKLLHLLNQKKENHPFNLLGAIHNLFGDPYNRRYNSDLFRSGLCDKFYIEDDVLGDIITDLRRPKNSVAYDFSVIPIDVLGTSYEEFIGHILKIGKGVTQKLDIGKRKSEGIYYTPPHIVSYILEKSLGEYFKSHKDFENLKVIDPTCGSGSFLLKAFEILVEEYKNINQKEEVMYNEKINLLLNCLYGVDKDERACDIAKLNLSLKLATRREKIPELHDNILNYDSLIDDESITGNKGLKWQFYFKDFYNDKGFFDVIVGNPPYVHQKGEKGKPKIEMKTRDYFRNKYDYVYSKDESTKGGVKLNMFVPYIERFIKLLREDGYFGFIVHKNLLRVESYKFIRKFILDSCVIKTIVDMASSGFKITGETAIFILKKESNEKIRMNNKIEVITHIPDVDIKNGTKSLISQSSFYKSGYIFNIYSTPELEEVKNSVLKSSELLSYLDESEELKIVSFGFGIDNKYIVNKKIDSDYKQCIRGRDIVKFGLKPVKKFVYYNKRVLTRIGDEQAFLSKEKIVMQRIAGKIIATLDEKQNYCENSINMILPTSNGINLKYLLGILNSKLIEFYYKNFINNRDQVTNNVTQTSLGKIPIRINKQHEKQVIELVDKLLLTQEELVKLSENDKEYRNLSKIFDRYSKQLDEEIYELYDVKTFKGIIEKSLE